MTDPDLVFGVPTHYHRLAAELETDPDAAATIGRARLLVSGAAALTGVDHARLQRLTGLAVRERYELTETLILTAARADKPPEPGTVGRPLAGTCPSRPARGCRVRHRRHRRSRRRRGPRTRPLQTSVAGRRRVRSCSSAVVVRI